LTLGGQLNVIFFVEPYICMYASNDMMKLGAMF